MRQKDLALNPDTFLFAVGNFASIYNSTTNNTATPQLGDSVNVPKAAYLAVNAFNAAAAISLAEKHGLTRTEVTAELPNGQRKVAMIFVNGQDFWLKQTLSGSWVTLDVSGKPAAQDKRNQPIQPETAFFAEGQTNPVYFALPQAGINLRPSEATLSVLHSLRMEQSSSTPHSRNLAGIFARLAEMTVAHDDKLAGLLRDKAVALGHRMPTISSLKQAL